MIESATHAVAARLSFTGDFKVLEAGVFAPGSPITIEYDAGRLPQQPVRSNGLTCSSISCFARFEAGGPIHQYPFRSAAGVADPRRENDPAAGTILTGVIEIPPNADRLVLWFVRSGDYGWVHYDSDYGRNYNFLVRNGCVEPDAGCGPAAI